MKKLDQAIMVTFQKEAIHCYPAAATDPKLKDVAFLANDHRHILHFKVTLEVTHTDRDVEFILFKRELEALYAETLLKLDYKSMEMISDDLAVVIGHRYPNRFLQIEVWEDHENGSITSYQL